MSTDPSPPQDKYALGAAIQAAPGWLKFSQWITSFVREITSIAQLFKNGHGIIQHNPALKKKPVKGTQPGNSGTSANNDNSNADNAAQTEKLTRQPTKDIGTPTTPNTAAGNADWVQGALYFTGDGSTAGSGNGQGGDGNVTSGVPQDCGFDDWESRIRSPAGGMRLWLRLRNAAGERSPA